MKNLTFVVCVATLFVGLNVLATAENTAFNLPEFHAGDVILLGDAYIRNGVIGMNLESDKPTTSAGVVLYKKRIRLFNPETEKTGSFSTNFSFVFENKQPDFYGDGLVFFLCPRKVEVGSYLGMVNRNDTKKHSFVAIEFDSYKNLEFSDPNGNHIGINLDHMHSVKAVDIIRKGEDFHMNGDSGVLLSNGNLITAWIQYDHQKRRLSVFVSHSKMRPKKANLSMKIDLTNRFRKPLHVGFGGSTEKSTEHHVVHSWSFKAYGMDKQNHNDSSSTLDTENHIHRKRSKVGLAIGLSASLFVMIFLFAFFSVKKIRERRRSLFVSRNTATVVGTHMFQYLQLLVATDGFDPTLVIGQGPSWIVYQASLSNTVLAVKKSKSSVENDSNYALDLSTVALVRHKSLVKLHGCSFDKGILFLVYDFMPNGSVEALLHGQNSETTFNWYNRRTIAVQLATVLSHLHEGYDQPLIHGLVKTSNILLDRQFNAKLADFGLANLRGQESTFTSYMMGYMAPEYLEKGTTSVLTDIYSFGVVLIELACGRRPVEKILSETLVEWVWGLYTKGRLIEAADERLHGAFNSNEMITLLLLGLHCTNTISSTRPSMRTALKILRMEAAPPSLPQTRQRCMNLNSAIQSMKTALKSRVEASLPSIPGARLV